jgi:hypothetical protein
VSVRRHAVKCVQFAHTRDEGLTLGRDASLDRVEHLDLLGRDADVHDDVVACGLEFEGEERAALALAGRKVASGGLGFAGYHQIQSRRLWPLHSQHMGEEGVELRDP